MYKLNYTFNKRKLSSIGSFDQCSRAIKLNKII